METGCEPLGLNLSEPLMERGCIPCRSLTMISFCIHFKCVGGFFFSFLLFFFFKAYVATSTILANNDHFILLIALPFWHTVQKASTQQCLCVPSLEECLCFPKFTSGSGFL